MSYRERRKHRRVLDKNIVLVTLLNVPGQKDLEGRTFTCTTADISTGGVRLITSTKIPVGTVLDLRVAAVTPPAAFKHVGRVSWQLEVLAPPAFFVGIEFTTSDPSILGSWTRFVLNKLPTRIEADEATTS